jgi:hypothetical protein
MTAKLPYRNEDKRALADKWQGWAEIFQFGSLGLLFLTLLVLRALSQQQARTVVWYFVSVLFITATIGFVLAQKALKYRMAYLNAEGKRIDGLFDDAIKQAARKGKK